MVRRRPATDEATPRMGRPPKEPDLTTYAGRLGARLRGLREKRGWTVEEFRERLHEAGLSVRGGTVRSWERGDRTPPAETFPHLAATFGVAPGDLLPPE
ncbi:helix-turn-helix domain-containing protein [Alienimonas sp. DA493]|uniref:helix-turn-helix domain-containing protein n=1 Tax=Alienimonas sp. DA493 TaxID=3373605 RepID=UPI003754DAF6